MMHTRRISAIVILMLAIPGCARRSTTTRAAAPASQTRDPALAVTTTPAVRPRSEITPLIDYHKHMTGPAALPPPPPLLPTVALPAALEQLLRERERLMGVGTPGDLYTQDAVMLDLSNPTRWVRGREAVGDMLSRFVSASFRFHPSTYKVDRSIGFIAGTVSAKRGEDERHVLNFMLGVEKGGDGKWRISAESTTIKTPPDNQEPFTAERVLAELDAAGIRRALVLSDAYKIGGGWQRPGQDEYTAVQAENDWAAAQAARFPDRLVAFCSVHPLKEYAVHEVERCARIRGVRGFKLHFDDSKVDLLVPQHLESLRKFFRAANDHKLAIAVHVNQRLGRYGARYSEIFLKELLPLAPDIAVQIMHLSGDTGYPDRTDETLAVFADAIAAGDPRTKNMYFEVAGVVSSGQPDDVSERIVRRMRQIGMDRILFGSDGLPSPPPAQSWPVFRDKLPLTDDELRTIAGNVAPYMR